MQNRNARQTASVKGTWHLGGPENLAALNPENLAALNPENLAALNPENPVELNPAEPSRTPQNPVEPL